MQLIGTQGQKNGEPGGAESRLRGRLTSARRVKRLTHNLIHNRKPTRASLSKMNDLRRDASRCGEKHERYSWVARAPHCVRARAAMR